MIFVIYHDSTNISTSPFIDFFVHFLSEKKDDFEGCLKGVDDVLRVFEGCCSVFEVCLKGVWKNKIEV